MAEEPTKVVEPGEKTTEFWLTIVSVVASVLGGISGILPPSWAAIATSLSVALYSISRGLAKSG